MGLLTFQIIFSKAPFHTKSYAESQYQEKVNIELSLTKVGVDTV